jgi:hypothetical protein
MDKVVPPKGVLDALHLGIVIVEKINYLLTWNCKHIANGDILKKIIEYCQRNNYQIPVICTSYELMERIDYE